MGTQDTPSVEATYKILTGWAKAEQVKTYSDLSREYQMAEGGDLLEPHGTWDRPLGTINLRLARKRLPALSALVVLKDTQEPGGDFWGCAPNVPPRPKSDIDRVAAWAQIVKDVFAAQWPPKLPR